MTLYAALAAALFAIGLHGVFAGRHRLRKILALNVMTTAAFLLLVVVAERADPVDPVPHAMVLTGIVVSVCTTAVAVALAGFLAREEAGSAGPRGGPGGGEGALEGRGAAEGEAEAEGDGDAEGEGRRGAPPTAREEEDRDGG